IGKLTTMTLVRQVVEAVSIPVIAAGGIADGAGAAAAFMLGAEAVQVGTRFVVATESNAHQAYKEKVLKAKDIDTTVSASI
ncbi:nitronate monooxygenase, partial [Klebsiella pneumoniae]